jgi:hypothetical protein
MSRKSAKFPSFIDDTQVRYIEDERLPFFEGSSKNPSPYSRLRFNCIFDDSLVFLSENWNKSGINQMTKKLVSHVSPFKRPERIFGK